MEGSVRLLLTKNPPCPSLYGLNGSRGTGRYHQMPTSTPRVKNLYNLTFSILETFKGVVETFLLLIYKSKKKKQLFPTFRGYMRSLICFVIVEFEIKDKKLSNTSWPDRHSPVRSVTVKPEKIKESLSLLKFCNFPWNFLIFQFFP